MDSKTDSKPETSNHANHRGTAQKSLHDTIVLITGARSGIGRATAEELARRGATLLLVCRTPEQAEATAETIATKTSNSNVYGFAADLSSQSSVRQLVAQIQARKREFPRIDRLIHNAAVLNDTRKQTEDGIEETFAVNVLAPYMLTCLLLDELRASNEPRVINVSSIGERYGKIHWHDLQYERTYHGVQAYNSSKLLLTMLTYEFARRFNGMNTLFGTMPVTVNCLHPGSVQTGLLKHPESIPWYWRMMMPIIKGSLITPEEASATTLYLASSAEMRGVTGAYFAKQRRAHSSVSSTDPAAARKLWNVCAELTGVRLPVEAVHQSV
jgi:NAD(P)-dependent dehydrogenase (short-subunit alcohol dehydrogenase family)